jgi:DNA-binding transcriptional regulator YhcF (GntR family)
MDLLKKELGKALSVKELANYLDADAKTIRKYYQELGGIRIGRHFKFFEKEVINAVQTWNEIHRTSEEEQKENREGIQEAPRSSGLGIGNEANARSRLEREDRHGLFG